MLLQDMLICDFIERQSSQTETAFQFRYFARDCN